MSKINVAFAVNDGYVQHLLIAMYSLLKNNSGSSMDVRILQRDFTQTSKNKIMKLGKHFKNASITFVDMNDKMELFKDIPLVIEYISIETYFRFTLADLFPELDKILYLDADILVPGNLSTLWNTDLGDYYAAGVEDPHIIAEGYKREINFTDQDLYVNAGVLLLNLAKIRSDHTGEKLFANIAHQPKIRYQDQDILNITFKGKVKKIGIINNFLWGYQQHNRDLYGSATVVHYTGPIKPWQNYNQNERPFWFYVYDEYVDELEREINKKPDLRTEKYGLFTYTTENVGDDIQSIGARQFLPKVDYYIDRDDIDGQGYKDATTVKLIMNGWYTHRPENWPPNTSNLDPLLVAMYFSSEHSDRVKSAVLSPASREFFKKNGPVGVRDYTTEKFFKSNKIDSFFSGCLTLTIQKSPRIKKQSFILAVDIPEESLKVMRKQTKRRIITVSPEIITTGMSPVERLKVAEWFLALVQSAHCVVTSRLHAALPSLALETPVLFMLRKGHRETDRFRGLIELTHSMGEEEYNKNPKKYNIEHPPLNRSGYLELRKSLTEKAQGYTGFINTNGFLTDELPFEVDNYDFVQRFFDSLLGAYRYQNLQGVLTNKSEYVATELEQYARHLKVLELEHIDLDKAYNALSHKYNKITKYPRMIRNGLRQLIKDRK